MSSYCSFCGTKLREDGKFCEGCGKPVLSGKDMAKEIESFLRNEITKEIELNVRREMEPKIKKEIEEKLREENKIRFEYEVDKAVTERISKTKKWSLKNISDKIKNNTIVQYILILFGVLIVLNIIFFLITH